MLSRPQAPTIRLCQALATYRGPRVISTYRRAGRARLRVAPLDWRYLQNERFGSSYSAAAANIPAINKMNPRANQRSSRLINENIRDAYSGLPQGRGLCVSPSGNDCIREALMLSELTVPRGIHLTQLGNVRDFPENRDEYVNPR